MPPQAESSLTLNEFALAMNAMFTRRAFLNQQPDSRRNIDKECGYKETLDKYDYKRMFERNPIANRVVNVLPKECWQVAPEVYEEEDSEETTEFEQAVANLPKTLVLRSWAKTDKKSSPIWEALCRLDILSGVGSFGVLLIGIDDGLPLDQPIQSPYVQPDSAGVFNASAKKRRQLKYLRVLDESLVEILSYENDRSNPRYDQPVYYNLTLNDPTVGNDSTNKPSSTTVKVHWSRIVHVADNMTSSEVFGMSRQHSVWDRLYDLKKLYGGSAEMYWQGAFPGLSVETHPQLGGDVELPLEKLKEAMENYREGLQRWLAIAGASVKTLSPQVVDPSPQINGDIESICIQIGCPVRVFKGSERGELASSQDDSAWNDRLRQRQHTHITPRIITPFFDRLIMMGVLPEPQSGEYCVEWPDLESLSDKDKVDIATKRVQALVSYITGGGESVVDAQDLLTRFLGFDEEEATSMIDKTMERVQEEDTGSSPLLSLVGGLTGFVDLVKSVSTGQVTPEQAKATMMIFFGMSDRQAEAAIAEQTIPQQPALPDPNAFPPADPNAAFNSAADSDWEDEADARPFDGVENAFCPTGPGGGVDPTCKKGGGSSSFDQEITSLFLDYGAGGTAQHRAVSTIMENLTAKTPLGVELKKRIDKTTQEAVAAEKKAVSADVEKEVKKGTEWRGKKKGKIHPPLYDHPVTVEQYRADLTEKAMDKMALVRRGSLDGPIQSWSRNPDGARGFGFDHYMPSIQAAVDKGYSVLGYLGQSHEAETTLIRLPKETKGKRKTKVTNAFCPTGKGGGSDPTCSPHGPKAKFIGATVGAAEHKAADATSNGLAKSLKGKVEEHTGGPGQKDKKPYDVRVKKKGAEGFHDIEVKTFLKGSKTSISVHEDALLRKVEHINANPQNTFHTIVVDKRNEYGGGAYAQNYSGHDLYYKRGSGRYALSKMHKVSSPAELKKLLDTPDSQLPAGAKGQLPPPPPVSKLKKAAKVAHESRSARDKARKERNKDVLRQQARSRYLNLKGASHG